MSNGNLGRVIYTRLNGLEFDPLQGHNSTLLMISKPRKSSSRLPPISSRCSGNIALQEKSNSIVIDEKVN